MSYWISRSIKLSPQRLLDSHVLLGDVASVGSYYLVPCTALPERNAVEMHNLFIKEPIVQVLPGWHRSGRG